MSKHRIFWYFIFFPYFSSLFQPFCNYHHLRLALNLFYGMSWWHFVCELFCPCLGDILSQAYFVPVSGIFSTCFGIFYLGVILTSSVLFWPCLGDISSLSLWYFFSQLFCPCLRDILSRGYFFDVWGLFCLGHILSPKQGQNIPETGTLNMTAELALFFIASILKKILIFSKKCKFPCFLRLEWNFHFTT